RSPRQTPRNRARSTPRARRCFAATCGRCGPFRIDRWRGWLEHSWRVHQADEDVFERRLAGVEIGEADTGGSEVAEQAGDAGTLAPGVVVVDQRAAAVAKIEAIGCKLRRDRLQAAQQMDRQALLAQLLHEAGLFLDQDDLALVDDAD